MEFVIRLKLGERMETEMFEEGDGYSMSVVKPAPKSYNPIESYNSIENYTSTDTITQHIESSFELADLLEDCYGDANPQPLSPNQKVQYSFVSDGLQPGQVDIVFPIPDGHIDKRILKIYGSLEYRDEYQIADQFVRLV